MLFAVPPSSTLPTDVKQEEVYFRSL